MRLRPPSSRRCTSPDSDSGCRGGRCKQHCQCVRLPAVPLIPPDVLQLQPARGRRGGRRWRGVRQRDGLCVGGHGRANAVTHCQWHLRAVCGSLCFNLKAQDERDPGGVEHHCLCLGFPAAGNLQPEAARGFRKMTVDVNTRFELQLGATNLNCVWQATARGPGADT